MSTDMETRRAPVLAPGWQYRLSKAGENVIRGPITIGLIGCLVLSAVLLVSAASDAEAASKRVGCFKKAFPGPGDDPAFRKRPGKCVYIDKSGLSVPVPPSQTTQTTQGVSWRKWGGRRAEGRGKGFVAAKKQPVAVLITLSRPVKRCGRRSYSRAKFSFPHLGGDGARFRLVTC